MRLDGAKTALGATWRYGGWRAVIGDTEPSNRLVGGLAVRRVARPRRHQKGRKQWIPADGAESQRQLGLSALIATAVYSPIGGLGRKEEAMIRVRRATLASIALGLAFAVALVVQFAAPLSDVIRCPIQSI